MALSTRTKILLATLLVFTLFFSQKGTNKNVGADFDVNINARTQTTNNALSVVNGVPGVTQFTMTVTIQNTGNYLLTCDIDSLSPPPFDVALTKLTKNIHVGETASWTTDFIQAAQFESYTQPVDFVVDATCTFIIDGTTYNVGPKSDTLPITVTA